MVGCLRSSHIFLILILYGNDITLHLVIWSVYHITSCLTRFCVFIDVLYMLVIYKALHMFISIVVTLSKMGNSVVFNRYLTRKTYDLEHPECLYFHR